MIYVDSSSVKKNEKNTRQDGKPRICFVAHFSYGALTGGSTGQIGGVERQTSLTARWFAARGYQVSVLTWDVGQDDGVDIDGVRVFKMCRSDAGIKGLRFIWPMWTSLMAAMKKADADIYYHNYADCVTGQARLWCRWHNRKFIFSVAHDLQCDARLPALHAFRERILYRYGLKTAHKVIVQSKKQQDMMHKNFGRDSVILPMPCSGPSEDGCANHAQTQGEAHRVLWIGRISRQKRPHLLLELAKTCPDMIFDLVGPEDGSDYTKDVCERANHLANIEVHGPALRDRVPEFYKKATAMCCTSNSEGFPNTFLEAWSHGLPIVSTFDPDDLIANKGLGITAQDVPDLARGLHLLCESEDQRRNMSERVRQFYLENYTVDAVMAKYEKVFQDVYNDAG